MSRKALNGTGPVPRYQLFILLYNYLISAAHESFRFGLGNHLHVHFAGLGVGKPVTYGGSAFCKVNTRNGDLVAGIGLAAS